MPDINPQDDLEAKKAALQHLKDLGMFNPQTDDPEGLLDSPSEHFQRLVDQHKKDLEDALNNK